MAMQSLQPPTTTQSERQTQLSRGADRRRAGGSRRSSQADRSRDHGSISQEQQWANGLGWFSIALGLAELAAPRGMARLVGVRPDYTGLIRALGLREIASGVGILAQRAPASGVWARVGGDAMDLACLGAAFLSPGAQKSRVISAGAAVMGVTVLDVLCAQQLTRGAETRDGVMPVTVSLAINRSPQELYRFWRDFTNLPRFMHHLQSVQVTGDRRSHWVATGPAGTSVEWDAEITEERPDELIAWCALEGSDVHHAGSIRFSAAPQGRGTFVTVQMQYRPPAGALGAAVGALFGEDPSQTIKSDLRRFKQLMETGEIITTEGQPAGRTSSTSWKYDQAVKR